MWHRKKNIAEHINVFLKHIFKSIIVKVRKLLLIDKRKYISTDGITLFVMSLLSS